ncbi:TadE/TadG family type IV pilus assembly protein [Stutzerimonas kirkiae]|uniref:Pilus assembly protein n=1 Tax=Stutzerimonas kirkiae TaxID=2211392 RepID=A0A4Q9R2Q8_9GAMM|nr:pilus assembly protein [Stutzerimonas kirkiae]TBU93524.1 hypothetical protein DNJ96_13880 [Stutzerimonas kirkiae]TBV01730.1 hypothetical protein DNJ95_11400 [Stutzerimonas kirkiae]TBV07428.1 hypothetical protein DNK08_12890 [Stutzerimonas kirkiae]TBV11061.1 hypothetical protein DNK01_16900 [Stutzerimonas kirkiae]
MKNLSRLGRLWRRSALRRLGLASGGSVAIEAALLLPLGLFAGIGAWELYSYYRAVSVVDRAAFMIANSVAMQRQLVDGGDCDLSDHICTYGALAPDLLQPLGYREGGGLVISLFATQTLADDATPAWEEQQRWQRAYQGSANLARLASRLDPPSGFPQASTGDTMVVVEVFYDYRPFSMSTAFWQSLGGERTIASRVFQRPRFTSLQALQ